MTMALTQAQAEFRGFWVDGFNEGFHTPAQVDMLLQRARTAKMNAIIVQMRSRADTEVCPYGNFSARDRV